DGALGAPAPRRGRAGGAPMTPADDAAFEDALRVAPMYYHLGLTTTDIAKRRQVARPTVPRLLGWAPANGLAEVRLLDPRERQLGLETRLEREYGVQDVKVVPAHPSMDVASRQQAVAAFTAHYLNSLLEPGAKLALAWGATVSLLANRLIPKPLPGVDVVQMNG